MKDNFRVAVLCGGRSSEHEISLCSAWNLITAMDREKFEPVLIGIDKDGCWYLQEIEEFLKQEPFAGTITLPSKTSQIAMTPGAKRPHFYNLGNHKVLEEIDVIFPMLHGPNGEDGSMQGLLQHLQIPYVGAGVLSSSICMDKDIAKRLMQHAKIPTSDFLAFWQWQIKEIQFDDVVTRLGLPIFVKPANLGSSVGISKVGSATEFLPALEKAFQFDPKIVIEQFVAGREIECAVLGNEHPISSVPGQYVHEDEFFAYDTKYLKGHEVKMEIPALDLSNDKIEEARALAVKTYQCLQCEGLSRVDIFLTDNGDLLVNEVNTLPGFTNNSMYPGLMANTGIPYTELITRLIELAIDRFGRDSN